MIGPVRQQIAFSTAQIGGDVLAPTLPPEITLSVATLSPTCVEGNSPAIQEFTIQNTGEEPLLYTILTSATWLSCSPAAGTSTGEADTIEVTYTVSSKVPGTYTATITVTDSAASNDPQIIAVTLTITTMQAIIALVPTTLEPTCEAGAIAASQTFTVQNTGGGHSVLNYTISDDVSWLSISPTSGASSSEADTITVTYTALAIGSYGATITVTDANAANSPQTVAVTMQVVITEDFESEGTMPAWASAYEVVTSPGVFTWAGGVANGQTGNCMRISSSGTTAGDKTAKTVEFSIPANTACRISIRVKMPYTTNAVWRLGYRLGSHTATEFQSTPGTTVFQSVPLTPIKDWEEHYVDTPNNSSETVLTLCFDMTAAGGIQKNGYIDTLRITKL